MDRNTEMGLRMKGGNSPMETRLGAVVASLGNQVLAGMGLHVVAYSGGEEVFWGGFGGYGSEFRRICVLGTDGRHGESVAQILEQLYPDADYEVLLAQLEAEEVPLAASHAQVISDSCGRRSKSHPSLQVVQIVAQSLVRASREQPLMLVMDQVGLGQLDVQLMMALARYPHVPILLVFQVSSWATEQSLLSIQRLKDVVGNRVVSLVEPGTRDVVGVDWLDFDDPDFREVRTVAMLAALLGRIPDPVALGVALEELGFMSGEFAQEVLTRAGKLTTHGAWQWKRYSDVEALRRLLRDSDERVRVASAAMRACFEVANAQGATSSEVLRFAEMCELAEQPELAFGPLRRAALGFHSGDGEVCRRLMARHAQLLDLVDSERDRLHQQYVLARTEASEGHHLEANRIALDLLERATTLQMPGLAANAQRLIAIVAWEMGRHADAELMMSFAAEAHVELRDWSHAGQDFLMLGWWADRSGRFEDAYALYQRAVGCFEEVDDRGRMTEAMALHAVSLIAQQSYDEAWALLDQAEQGATGYASLAVHADILNSRSEVARARQDWELAHSYATQSLAWFQMIGHRFAHITRFNLGLIALGAQRFGDARAVFEELLGLYPAAGLEARLPVVDAGLAVASLAWRDHAVFDAHLFSVETAVTVGFRHNDLPWILQQGLELAARTGQEEAMERLLELLELHFQPR